MTSPNRQLPVLYAAASDDMKVEYTSDDRDSADAYAFACKLKVYAYPPPTQMREVERVLQTGELIRDSDRVYSVTTYRFGGASGYRVGTKVLEGEVFVRRETIAQGIRVTTIGVPVEDSMAQQLGSRLEELAQKAATIRAQGPARCGTCPFCNRDAADEEGRSYCLLNVRLVRANEYCSMHPQNQEREGRG